MYRPEFCDYLLSFMNEMKESIGMQKGIMIYEEVGSLHENCLHGESSGERAWCFRKSTDTLESPRPGYKSSLCCLITE